MTLSVSITFPASTPPPPPVARVVGWRGRHYVTENGRPTEWVGAPAIIPAFTDGSVIMTEPIQRLSYELMKRFCPTMDGGRWATMHGSFLAMCNRTGFGDPNNPRRDYINGLDLTAELPRYDKCRTFQGSFITGRLEGNLIVCTPGVDGIDANAPLPTVDEVIAKHWYSVAINTGEPPFHWRPNWGGVIVFPFIMRGVMKFESQFFAAWDSDVYPNPIVTYTPA